MAEEKKGNFPLLPVTNWWALRKRFKQTIPSSVTVSYLSTVLSVGEKSAGNLIPAFRQIGLIDQEGKPLERATKWRDDQQYAEVCQSIKQEIYPQELVEAIPSPLEDRSPVERWFANRTGLGQAAVRRMATFYLLLCEADPSKESEKGAPVVKPQQQKQKKEPQLPQRPKRKDAGTGEFGREYAFPALNINVQVHISPEATTTQIDQIFASMAKHLGRRNNGDTK